MSYVRGPHEDGRRRHVDMQAEMFSERTALTTADSLSVVDSSGRRTLAHVLDARTVGDRRVASENRDCFCDCAPLAPPK